MTIELETMNEELQSTNEELLTIDDELHGKPVLASISFAPLFGVGSEPRGAILTMTVEPLEASA
jgi:hypothetical protein